MMSQNTTIKKLFEIAEQIRVEQNEVRIRPEQNPRILNDIRHLTAYECLHLACTVLQHDKISESNAFTDLEGLFNSLTNNE